MRRLSWVGCAQHVQRLNGIFPGDHPIELDLVEVSLRIIERDSEQQFAGIEPPDRIRRRRQLLGLFDGGRLDMARVAAERWLRAIDLEGVKPEEEALANAFGVLIGRSGRVEVLIQEARFLSVIISATRAVGLDDDVLEETLDAVTERLVQVATDLQDRQLDLPLLPPLTG